MHHDYPTDPALSIRAESCKRSRSDALPENGTPCGLVVLLGSSKTRPTDGNLVAPSRPCRGAEQAKASQPLERDLSQGMAEGRSRILRPSKSPRWFTDGSADERGVRGWRAATRWRRSLHADTAA
jgi:hypothetical protein